MDIGNYEIRTKRFVRGLRRDGGVSMVLLKWLVVAILVLTVIGIVASLLKNILMALLIVAVVVCLCLWVAKKIFHE